MFCNMFILPYIYLNWPYLYLGLCLYLYLHLNPTLASVTYRGSPKLMGIGDPPLGVTQPLAPTLPDVQALLSL